MYIDNGEIYPCPCCGYSVFTLEPGSGQACPICLWQDNLVQLRFPRMPNVANHVSLLEAQRNVIDCGAAEKKNADLSRQAYGSEMQEEGWRIIDVDNDNIEEPMRGINYVDSYPVEDLTVLYYWRDTYWRQLND